MRYVINTTDGTITDAADTFILDTSLMDNATYATFLEINDDDELIDLAKKIGVPIAAISDSFLDNTGVTA
jgi:hypothetical protein